MAHLSGADLKGCAQLLSRLIDSDIKDVPARSITRRPLFNTDRKGAIVKRKYRKPKAALTSYKPTATVHKSEVKASRPKPHRCWPEKEDSFETELQEVIVEYRKLMQAPTINDEAWLRDPPERDTPSADRVGRPAVSTPYNKRLQTSTPQRSPNRIKGKAEISLTDGAKLQGVVGDHAMNSYEFLKGLNAEYNKAPKLHHADVQYQPNPHTAGDQRFAFSQQINDAMRGVYIDNLKATLPKETAAATQAQYSMYSEEDSSAEKPCRDLSNKPAKELRPPISPFKVNTASAQSSSQPNNQQSTQPAVPSRQIPSHNQHTAQYPNMEEAPNMDTQQDPSLGGAGSQFPDIAHLSRAQLLQAALKVALQSGALDGLPAYMKAGPISPFRPGTGGFSAYGGRGDQQHEKDALNNQMQPDNLEESTLIDESDGLETPRESENQAGLRRTFPEYDGPKLRSSVADLHIPDAPQAKTKTAMKKIAAKNARIDALAVPKNKTKNKKIQHAPGMKKKQESSGKTTKKVPAKSVNAKYKGVLLPTQNVGIQASSKTTDSVSQSKADMKGGSLKSASFVGKTTSGKAGQLKDPNRLKSSSDIGIQTTPKQPGILKKPREVQVENEVPTKEDFVEFETSEPLENMEANKENEIESEIKPTVSLGKEEVLAETSNKQNQMGEKESIMDKEMSEMSENTENYKVPVLDQKKYNSLFVQIKHLTKELKAVPGIKMDKEGKRLLKELDEKVSKGKLDLQTDLDLAVQPIRSENAQLRRRMRILTQQLKEKEVELQNAEKPDPNFMVVHLQMQNFNLENELKATKQVVSKLKEEVQVYQAELQKLSTDRNDLLNLMGKPSDVSSATQLLRDNQGLKTQMATLEQGHVTLAKEKEDAETRLQLLSVTCHQKDQELANMQNLVQTLQASMKKLLTEMQTGSRESFMTSYTGFTDPKSINSRPSQATRDGSSLASSLPQQPSSLYQPPSSAHVPLSHHATQDFVKPIETGMVHPQPETGRPGFDVLSARAATSSEAEATNVQPSAVHAQRADTYDVSETGSHRNQDGYMSSGGGKRPQQQIATMPLPQIDEKVGLYLMDQPGLNYSKIAESINDAARKRRSLSTNPDTDITEYKAYPGMSPIQQTAFDKLDPFVKDLIRSQRQKNQERAPPSGESMNVQLSPTKAPSIVSTKASTVTPSMATVTESETKESESTGPTVKELLTPLADRMQRIQTISDTERSRAVRAINFDTAPESEIKPATDKVDENPLATHVPIQIGRPSLEVSDDSYTVALKKDIETNLQYEDSSSTLLTTETSDEAAAAPPVEQQNVTTGTRMPEGDSRYSVTDYFNKYPESASKSLLAAKNHRDAAAKRLSKCSEEIYDGDQSEDAQEHDARERWAGRGKLRRDKMSDSERHEMIGRWAEQVVISPGGVPMIFDNNSDVPDPQVSPQVKLYRGTDLDTSISTINDRDSLMTSNTEMTSNSVTTSGSLSSVDDRIFRQGLANLDANIERVQKSLREAML